MKRWTQALLAAVLALGLAAPALAQGGGASSTGTIQGRIADAQGAVLPGVTVTATSPSALGTQTTVSSETGNYRFPAVPPGTYTLTYELAGFNTVRREGIQITLGFTANVNVELSLASLQETVTVTGESPIIDTTSTRVQQNFKVEQLQSLPNGRDMWSLLAVTPAVQMARIDVGGNRAGTQTDYTAYGTTGQVRVLIEGINTTEGTGGAGFYFDYSSLEEVFMGTTGQTAEMPNPGVQSQFIAKSGGNTFSGEGYLDWYNNSLQGSNIPDDVIARGVRPHSNEMRELLRHRDQRRRPDQGRQGVVVRDLSHAEEPGPAAELHVRPDLRHQALERGRQGHVPDEPEQQADRLLPVGPEDPADPPAVRHLHLQRPRADQPPGLGQLGVEGRVERHPHPEAVRRDAVRRLRLLLPADHQRHRGLLLA